MIMTVIMSTVSIKSSVIEYVFLFSFLMGFWVVGWAFKGC